MFYSRFPCLDLHGENVDSSKVLIKGFLNDNYKLNNYNVVIIHGIGHGIIKKCVHEELKKYRFVKNYKIDNFNSGVTLVELSNYVDKNV